MILEQIGHVDGGGSALSPYLADLLARARISIEADPDFARSCLDEASRLLSNIDAIILDREEIAKRSLPKMARPTKGGLAPWQLKRVRAFIEDNLAETILVGDLAVVADLSPGHFCRAFKKSIGVTPHCFIVQQRLRRAQRLMLDTNDPLSQIAIACGLTDQAHLTRLFRRMLDETPLVWRRALRSAG